MVMNFIVDPIARVLERNLAFLTSFTDVQKKLGDETSMIYRNNDRYALRSENFRSHPKVHAGYYDELKENVLYVIDSFTNELIRKDQSVLLSNGTFTKSQNPLVVYDLPHAESIKPLLDKAFDGCTVARAELEKYWIYQNRGTHQVIPLKFEFIKKAMELRTIERLSAQIFQNTMDRHNLPHVPEEMEDAKPFWPEISKELLDNLNSKTMLRHSYYIEVYPDDGSDGIELPKNSQILPGIYLTGTSKRAYNQALAENFTPVMVLNPTTRSIIWSPRELGSVQVFPEITGFPFRIGIRINTENTLTINKKSNNNEGYHLEYNTKVTEYKVAFKMMPEEERHFAQKAKEHKALLKEWRARQQIIQAQAAKEGWPTARLVNALQADKKPVQVKEDLPIFLGLEIELYGKGIYRDGEGRAKLIRDIANSSFGNHCIIKRDGSIGNLGLEIVTVPATLAYHKDMFENNFFCKKYAFHNRLMSTEACGIHVHISKNSFNALSYGKFSAFINSKENEKFIDAMAGRPANKYCVRNEAKLVNKSGKDLSFLNHAKSICVAHNLSLGLNFKNQQVPVPEVRRVAVNLVNGNTIEVRMFKSSQDKNNILRKLEFCESLVRYTRTLRATESATLYGYIDFILEKENKKMYPYLVTWLASKNYIGHDRRKRKGTDKIDHIYGGNKVAKPENVLKKESK